MPSSSLEDKDVHYAYAIVHEFFDNFGLSGAVENTERILKTAISKKAWKKKAPFDALYFMQKLEQLCSTAFVIDGSYSPKAAAIIEAPETGDPELSSLQNFAGQWVTSGWEVFPRSLTAKQYHNPYKAIKKFVQYLREPEWKTVLQELTEYALSNGSIMDASYPYNILTLRLRMLQLIEACYLLEVRTYVRVKS
jgi:hypothetical protein